VVKPEDLATLVTLSDPRLHPDTKRVAFVVTRIDLEADGYRLQVHLHKEDDHQPFTSGPVDHFPRWSPDGSSLAFLRATDLAKPIAQVAVMPSDGGEARLVTDFPLGVESLAWSPDGSQLCVVAKSYQGDVAELSDEERSRRPRRVTEFPFRFDGRGWLHDRRRQLWLVDPTGQTEPRRLTGADTDETEPVWHPNGESIAFLTDLHPRRGLEQGADLVEVRLDGTTVRQAARARWWTPLFDDKGRLHAIGHPSVDYPRLDHVHRVDDGLIDLMPDLDRSLSLGPPVPQAVLHEDALWALIEDGGKIELRRFAPGAASTTLLSGDFQVTGFDRGSDGRIVAALSRPTRPSELVELVDGEMRSLVDFGTSLELASPEHWRVPSDDHEIDVWAYLPAGDGDCPVLLNIHGGPATQYGFGFFDEFQVYAGAGYAVVACNPRGSSGRGEGFVRSVREDGWGTVDVADVTAALESALARFPRLDRDRIGVMGGSYGGFLTAWTTAHDQRYKSAVVERALLSFPSFNGTSDIAPSFGLNYLGTEDLEFSWEKSPLAWVGKVRTPTLILHSEEDYRCPIEQAEQYLLGLWKHNVVAEMLRFPGEGHELSRSGKPKHRLERFQAILEWHARFLQPTEG